MSSPARKRQRLSSPTYDSQLPALSQQEIAAFDLKMSQSPKKDDPPPDDDNPFITKLITKYKTPGFAAASSIMMDADDTVRSPSPEEGYEEPQEKDYSAWFEGETAVEISEPISFQTAKFISAGGTGFMKASNKKLIEPSKEALQKAQEKIREWQEEEPVAVVLPASPPRQILRDTLPQFQNANSLSPGTPSPASVAFTLPSFSTPSIAQFTTAGKGKAKAFKSPLINPALAHAASTSTFASSPLNPNKTLVSSFRSAAGKTVPVTPVPVRRMVHDTNTSTPAMGKGKGRQPKFITPFKVGMRPGEPGRSQLAETRTVISSPQVMATSTPKKVSDTKVLPKRFAAFDLSPVPNRKTLRESGLMPQSYSPQDLTDMGIAYDELSQITPDLALYFSFHTPHPTPDYRLPTPQQNLLLGPTQALTALLDDHNCTLATQPWIENHYPLILWKISGLALLDPTSSLSPKAERWWCWDQVLRQLLYRYERDLNSSSRPALRLISTQDSPASSPLVFCISGIRWSGDGVVQRRVDEVSGEVVVVYPHPELEVTDGWYRMRAQVDEPLARAARRGLLKVGRKIAVAGARLDNSGKDPLEILEAYDKMSLVFSGNGSHLASWDAKLGFQRGGPFVATLGSLTADGGLVPVLDIVVVNVHPIAFFEFYEDEEGKKQRKGPMGEKEEAELAAAWEKRREVEVGKLRDETEKTIRRYEGYIDRLERRAGSAFRPTEHDPMPDYIDNLYDELEDPTEASAVLGGLNATDAGWLAQYVRTRMETDGDGRGEEIERDLQHTCPPRNVRSFRVLVVQDACTRRKPGNRAAQLTVWDALTVNFDEEGGGGANAFQVGHRYLVTNLMPTQLSAWMDCEPGSEVYLSTRRDSKWTKLKQDQIL